MAAVDVDNILKGLQLAQQRKSEAFRNAQAQAQLASQNQYRLDEVQNRKDELDQRAKQFDITTKAAKALHDAEIEARKNQIDQEGINRLDQINAEGVNRRNEISDSKDADFARFQMQKDEDTKRAAANKAADEQREKDREKANDLREKSREANDLAIAGIKANKGSETLQNFDPTPYVEGATNGTTSQDEIGKLPKDQKALVNGILSQSGVIAPTARQKQFVQGLGAAVHVIPTMDSYLQNLNDNPITARVGIGSNASNTEKTLRNQIQEGLVQATGSLVGASSRLSQPRIQAMSNAYGLSPSETISGSNSLKRQGYIDTLHDITNTELTGLKPAQIQHIKESIGLDQYPQTPAGLKPGTQVASPQQSQSSPVLAPTAPTPGQGGVQWGRDKNGIPVPIQ